MATKIGCLLLFILQIIPSLLGEKEFLQEKFTSRCGDICGIGKEVPVEEGKLACQRGCQYFNFEFLTKARKNGQLTDLSSLSLGCGESCIDAYPINRTRRDDCFDGCNKMMILQSKAPYLNGWLVYMGASERNMVLLHPDFDMPSKEDWVLLDSVMQSGDYDYDDGNFDKILAEDRRRMSIFTVPERFTIDYCITTWIWLVPIFLLLGVIWIHYKKYGYGIFEVDFFQQELINEKKYPDEDFVVGTDFNFYPAPAIPPPKYNEAVEAILMGSTDDEDALDCEHRNETLPQYIKNVV